MSDFVPRDYQSAAYEAIVRGLEHHDSVLAALPTGMGKTEIFVMLASQWQGRVMVVAPMIELIGQAAKKICQRTGILPAIEQGSLKSNETEHLRSPFVVASKQTLTSKSERFRKFQDISLLIVDECHLAGTPAYKKLINYFIDQGAKVLGVTATPKRHDGVGLHEIFDECVFNLGIREAVQDGWLVPARAQCCTLKNLDLSEVKTSNGDFVKRDLERAMSADKVIYEVAEITAAEWNDEKTVVFCAAVAEAKQVAELLSDRYQLAADWVSGACDKQRRHEVLDGFTSGDLGIVCNVGVLTTGWDFPGLKHIVMARPTKSLPLYTQIFGRGTRPLPGVVDFEGSDPESRRAAIAASDKPAFRMTDLRDNSRRHKLVNAFDVLAGRAIPDDVKGRAADLAATGEFVDVQLTLDEAAEQLQHEAAKRARDEAERRARLARAALAAQADYDKAVVDVFNGRAAVAAAKDLPWFARARMPFGKHKGTPMDAVPTRYLEWCMGLLPSKPEKPFGGKMGEMMTLELERRGRLVPQESAATQPMQLDFFSSLKGR